jgi:hypothetical protein
VDLLENLVKFTVLKVKKFLLDLLVKEEAVEEEEKRV